MLPLPLLLIIFALLWSEHGVRGFWTPPTKGIATLTHYDLPADYIASCGCVGRSTRYPTAAINALAYGGTTSFAPSCGACYSLSLLNTSYSPPPPDGDGIVYAPGDSKAPTVVVKITDLCPLAPGWCNATETKGNTLGSLVHFDLAWPSKGISKDFFPGDHDYGVWWSSYERVDCKQWAGYNDREAVGSDWQQQDSACCPSDPAFSSLDSVASSSSTASASSSTSASLLSSSSLSSSPSASSSPSSLLSSSSSSSSNPRASTTSTSSSHVPRSLAQCPASRRRRSATNLQSRDVTSALDPQSQMCPSYSEVLQAGQSLAGLVPNTSNILSKKDDHSNAATSNNLYRQSMDLGQWISWLLASHPPSKIHQGRRRASRRERKAYGAKRRCTKNPAVPQEDEESYGDPPLLKRRDL